MPRRRANREYTQLDYTDSHVQAYAEFYRQGQRGTKVQLIWNLLGDLKAETVLDVGVGSGFFSQMCLDLGAKVVSIDFADAVIRYHREHGARLQVVQGDAQSMPFRSGEFSTVLALDVIEHLPRAQDFLAEARRVLQQDGRLILLTDNSAAYVERVLSPIMNRLARLTRRHEPRQRVRTPYCTHVEEWSVRELAAIVRRAGFRIDWITTYSESFAYRFMNRLLRWITPSSARGYLWKKVVLVAGADLVARST